MNFSDLGYLLKAIVKLPITIKRDGIGRVLFISGLVSIGVGLMVSLGAWFVGDDLGKKLVSLIPWVNTTNWGDIVGIWLGRIIVLVVGIILYKHLVLNIASQFLGGIAENIMKDPNHSLKAFENPGFQISMQRGIRLSIRNIVYELLFTIILLIIGAALPVVFVITSVIIFLVQAYYAGFGITDLFLEKYMSADESIVWNRHHRIMAVGIGSIFLGLLLLPIIGFLIAPGIATIVGIRGMVQVKEFRG